MDMESLRDFVTVCREGKMTRAAEKLFMSKQTLSAIIKKMEGEMGAALLIRGNSGVELTREGACFFEYAEQMLALWERCQEDVERVGREGKRALTVGFAYMSWNLWTQDIGAQFVRQYPQIELSTAFDLSKNLLRRLDEGQCDVIVTCMQQEHYARYKRAALCDVEISVLMTRDDPLAAKAVLEPRDLDGRLVLYPDSGAGFLRQFARDMAQLGVAVQTHTVPAGNFLGNLKAVRDEEALLLSNGIYREVAPDIEGYVYRMLNGEGEGAAPRIAICALMRKEDGSCAAKQFIAFFSNLLKARFGREAEG